METLTLIFGCVVFFGSFIALIFLIIKTIKKKKKPKTTNAATSTDNYKQKTSSGIPSRMMNELLPHAMYDVDEDCYKLSDGTYLNLLKLVTKDLENSSDEEVEYDIMRHAKLYKTYADDIKIISMNFPCNTQNQQSYWSKKAEKCKNTLFSYWIEKNITVCQLIEQNCESKEFYLMFWAKDLDDHRKKLNQITNILGVGVEGLVEDIPAEKKHQITYRLNNKNSLLL